MGVVYLSILPTLHCGQNYGILIAMGRSVYEFSYKERKKLRNTILFFVGLFLLIFALHTLFSSFLLFPVVVKSDSMLPRTDRGGVVLASPIGSVDRGTTVILRPQLRKRMGALKALASRFVSFVTFQQLQAFEPGGEAFSSGNVMRRVVGLPGDTIYMKDFILYVRPAGDQHFLTEFELAEVSYDINIGGLPEGWDRIMGAAGNLEEQTLGEGEYFLLCDNRIEGVDSRIWGPVHKKAIGGKALFQYFPFSGFGTL